MQSYVIPFIIPVVKLSTDISVKINENLRTSGRGAEKLPLIYVYYTPYCENTIIGHSHLWKAC